MKNIFTTILLLLLLLSLAACDSGTQQATETVGSTPPPVEVAEDPVTEQLAEQPPIIERSVLFGNPLRFQGRLSPDGTKMSFRAPLDGVMNLWVGERGDFSSVKAITSDTGRGIPSHFWALDSQHVLYIQDQGGDENWHLYSVDLASGETIDLSPYEGTQAQMLAQSETAPGVAIIGMNDRDPKWHDIYSVDLKTGERKWQERAVGKGSVCFADGMLYLFSEKDGRAGLATCSPDGLELKGTVRVAGEGPSWAHPVVIGGRLYLRYDDHLYCFDVRA